MCIYKENEKVETVHLERERERAVHMYVFTGNILFPTGQNFARTDPFKYINKYI